MPMKTSGNLSIQTATGQGTDGEINTNVSGVNSGSLVTLGQNSVAYTGGTGPNGGTANTSVAPYGMREYYGYVEYYDPSTYDSHTVLANGTRNADGPNPDERPSIGTFGSSAGIYMWQNYNFSGGGFATRRNSFSIRVYSDITNFNYFSGSNRAVLHWSIKKGSNTQGSDHRAYYNASGYYDLNNSLYSNWGSINLSSSVFSTNNNPFSSPTGPDSYYVRWIQQSATNTGFGSTTMMTGSDSAGSSYLYDAFGPGASNYTLRTFNGSNAFSHTQFYHNASTECSSTSSTLTGWIQIVVRKAGYADTALATIPVYSFIRMTWTGAYCF